MLLTGMFTVENNAQKNQVDKRSMSWKLEWDIKKYQTFFFLYISCLEMLSANPGCRILFLWDFSMLANLQADISYHRGLKKSTQLWIQRIQKREPTTCAQMITFGQTSSGHYHKCIIWNMFCRNRG